MLNHTRSSENSRSGSIGLDRAANRQPFIPNEPLGTIGGGYHSEFSNPPIRMGDELWFYYGSSQFGKNVRPNIGGICLSKLRLDGFASMEGGCYPGTLTTRPLDFNGKILTVNCLPRKGGNIGVEGFLQGIFVATMVNTGAEPLTVTVSGLPAGTYSHIQTTEAAAEKTLKAYLVPSETVAIQIPGMSIHILTTRVP